MSQIILPSTLHFNSESIIVDNKGQGFIVCCFFTPSYEYHAEHLKQSLEQQNINYLIKTVPEQGHWEANTRIKPYFLKHCLQEMSDKNILYLDADAIVKGPLDYFNNRLCDIAVYHTKRVQGMSHDYLTGTIFLKNSQATKDFVDQWCAVQNECNQTMVDQDSFDKAMKISSNNLVVEDLPLSYIKIFDKDFEGDVYIEQYQASRTQTKLRRKKIRWRNRAIGVTLVSLMTIAIMFVVI